MYLHLLRREQGRLDELVPVLEAELQQRPVQPLLCAQLAQAYAETGRLSQARDLVVAFAAPGYDQVRRRDWVWAEESFLLSEVAGVLGDPELAADLYGALVPYVGRSTSISFHPYIGVFDRYLGLLATALGRHDEAERLFEAAQVQYRRMQSPPWIARTNYDFARLLLTRNGAGDRARAAELLSAALETARELGMTRLLEEIAALEAASATGNAKPTYPAGLSEREVEVLRLLAAGKSNREIGETLVISLNTVNRHVTHIFEKTGTQNRVEAAAFAHQHRLG